MNALSFRHEQVHRLVVVFQRAGVAKNQATQLTVNEAEIASESRSAYHHSLTVESMRLRMTLHHDLLLEDLSYY